MNNAITRLPTFVGIDRLMNDIESALSRKTDSYPPHNVIKDGNEYRIEIALAGYPKESISAKVEGNTLTVSASKREDIVGDYVHHGISSRSVHKTFQLGERMEIDGADFVDGLLVVHLVEVTPEEDKPKLIEIA